MPLSDRVRRFIFEHLDSVELLQSLLRFYAEPSRAWSAQTLAAELRAHPNSIERRLEHLRALGAIRQIENGNYVYNVDFKSSDVVGELAEAYRIQSHKIYELIFSPLKKARDFADSFSKSPRDGKKAGDDV